MTKNDEELRRLILARRARFVAAAMGTSGVLVGCVDSEPSVCLSPPFYGDFTEATSSDTSPSVCLSPTSGPPETTGPSPSVCLSPLTSGPPETTGPTPSVCLSPTSGPPEASADAGADAGDGAIDAPETSAAGSDAGRADLDAGAITSGLEATSTTVPTPCLSPPLLTDLGLDTSETSAPDAGDTPDASGDP